MITDASIKKALRDAPTSGKKTIELKDDGPRGEGRLALIVRLSGSRIISEWYAVWWANGRRAMAKMGAYPTMSLAEARKGFSEDYAPAISRGQRPEAPKARKVRLGVTVKDLFDTYVAHLRKANQPCAERVERILLTGGTKVGRPAVKALGPTKRAADVTAQDCIPYLKEIYDRGSAGMAYMTRAYLSAAFAHAMACENSYTQAAGTVEWGIKVNPVSAIPPDADSRRVGQRHLNQAELCDFWHWLIERDDDRPAARAVRLIIVTGQRVVEIMKMSDKVWNSGEKMMDWGKTKNGRPHNLPVPDQGCDILNAMTPNRHGLYFPHRDKPTGWTCVSVNRIIEEYRSAHPEVPHFTARDLRRTWKTLAGAAGISKELRDRLQNHARSDVSSKHYDRWEMLPERRAAMEVWSKYLARIIAGEFKDTVVQLPTAAAG